jgi:hypothetical protein
MFGRSNGRAGAVACPAGTTTFGLIEGDVQGIARDVASP